LAVAAVPTSGTPPGWIHDHSAVLADDGRSIVVQHGKLDRGGDERSLVENIDDWRLDLIGWRWERLTERRWQRWEARRLDGGRHHLFEIEQIRWSQRLGWAEKERDETTRLTEELGAPPDLDLAERLYRPPVVHEAKPSDDEEFNTVRIEVDGVVVRYVDTMDALQLTVEGDLPQTTIDALASDLRSKLSTLENAPCGLRRL
jgi:hypothetical protein